MKKLVFILCLFGLSNSWSLPWLQNKIDNLQSSADSKSQNEQSNFSGVWMGQCEDGPAVEMTIIHKAQQFTISYGFMEEHYILGELKSISSSHLNGVENSNTLVSWSDNNTGLIFINYNLFINKSGSFNGFFSKVTMALKEDQMTVTGHYYQTDSSFKAFEQQNISCFYNRR